MKSLIMYRSWFFALIPLALFSLLVSCHPILDVVSIDTHVHYLKPQPPNPQLSGPQRIIAQGVHPRATQLQNGSLLGTYVAFRDNATIIIIIDSHDEGITWNEIGWVDRTPSDKRSLDNPFLTQLDSGRILCTFENHDKRPQGGYSHHRLTVCYSDDLGRSWKYLGTIEQGGAGV